MRILVNYWWMKEMCGVGEERGGAREGGGGVHFEFPEWEGRERTEQPGEMKRANCKRNASN